MAEKRGRGKPKRYEGEDSVRLSVLLRPRYKQLIELVSKDRQSTLSEALEFIIASFGKHYITDGKPIIDYVRPEYERLGSYYAIIYPEDSEDDEIINACNKLMNFSEYNKLKSYPRSTLSKEDLFLIDTLSLVFNNIHLMNIFITVPLMLQVREDWKIGRTSKEVLADLGFLIFVYKEKGFYSYIDFFKKNSMENDKNKISATAWIKEIIKELKMVDYIGTSEYIERFSDMKYITKIASKEFKKNIRKMLAENEDKPK